MSNNRNDDGSEDERRDASENETEDTQNTLAQKLKESSLVTKKPGIKPS